MLLYLPRCTYLVNGLEYPNSLLDDQKVSSNLGVVSSLQFVQALPLTLADDTEIQVQPENVLISDRQHEDKVDLFLGGDS